MYPKSNKKITLKIVASYVVLGLLALLAGILIYAEFKNYTASQATDGNKRQLLKTNTLFAQLYEAENLSKLAMQDKKKKNLKAYARKVDSMSQTLDTLKFLSNNQEHALKLDSIQKLLQQKVFNSSELRKLKVKNENSAPIDSILKAFNKMEIDMGRITPETFVPNFNLLSPETQTSIREYVTLLNRNIPTESDNAKDANLLDSILQLSKSILDDAKTEQMQLERSTMEKELQIHRTDIQLSQKLRSIITELEQEFIENARIDNFNKQQSLKKSIRLAGGAIILGVLVTIIFTLLISKDFWKIQQYRRQLEKEKKFSESLLKSREQLISTVSHDLKTPLHTIGGYTELIEQSPLNSIQQGYLTKVKSATGYVEKLTNDLLDYSKLEHGKIAIDNVPFVLFELIEETAIGLNEMYAKKSVALKLEISEELKKPVISDPIRIRQILSNLIGNAFKFTKQGYVQINARIEEQTTTPLVKIEVIDSGIGIESKDQKTIFEEFRQASRTSWANFGGYGLGLTISKKLTGLLGGTLSLESQVNKGSVFTLVLPWVFSKVENEVQDSDATPLSNELTLLIIDDDTALLELLGEICKIHAITAHTFSSFPQPGKLLNLDYDVVLTDMQMPHVNGFEVIQKLKSTEYSRYKNQPIIAMTGQKDIDTSILANAGFDHVLEKPFSSVQLTEAIASVSSTNFESNDPRRDQVLIPQPKSEQFSVNTIAEFVQTPEALHNILQTFITNTRENMSSLFVAVRINDYDKIKGISHGMLPMFRQLKISEAIPILERLEKKPEKNCCKKDVEHLKKTYFQLEKAIQVYCAKLPIDID